MKTSRILPLIILGVLWSIAGCQDEGPVGSGGSGGAAGSGGGGGSGGSGGFVDECPDDPAKVVPGICGCGVADTDADKDAVADCSDDCVYDLSDPFVSGRAGAGECQCDGFCGPFYEVRRVADGGSAPVVDGVIDASEWDAANALTSVPYGQLRAMGTEPFGYRFRMLWDDSGLYVLLESAYSFHPPPSDRDENPAFDGVVSINHNLYFDPTFDFLGDPNEPLGAPDGYQIAWDVMLGRATRIDGVRSDPAVDPTVDYLAGLFLEAHVGGPFGDTAPWLEPGLISCANYRDCFAPELEFAQVANNAGLSGGSTTLASELFFGWSVFTAAGLEHTSPATIGERWKFEHALINAEGPGGPIGTDEGFLPSWSDSPSSTVRVSFAEWPHGTIVFVD